MRASVFLDEPECVLIWIKLLLLYFGDSREARALPYRSFERAKRVLKLMGRWQGDKSVVWTLPGELRDRLRLAGLDPDTLEVEDEYRWALCWEQLQRSRTFRDDIQRKWIALGRVAEPVRSRVGAVVIAPKGTVQREREKAKQGETITDYMTADLRARFNLRRSKA